MNNKGISLITMVMTIVVILILASIVYYNGYRTPDMATRANFLQAIDDMRIELRYYESRKF